MNQNQSPRRTLARVNQFTIGQLSLRNPWVVAFFSFAYPGFGHLMQHRYAPAFILIGWELFINNMAHVNLGIMYSLLGDFDSAKRVIEDRWLILYVGIYMLGIWDSYRTTVDFNKQYLLADREDAPVKSFVIGTWDINFLDKRKPWVAMMWSVLVPGLGHLYVHKVVTGFFIFGYTVLILYCAHIPRGIMFSMVGDFVQAKQVLVMQWLLYLPSIYFFILYDAYATSIEYNILFEKEMSRYLRTAYQNPDFEFPV